MSNGSRGFGGAMEFCGHGLLLMRAANDHLFREGQLLAWDIPAIGVLVETLLDRVADGDVDEAETAIASLAAGVQAGDGLIRRRGAFDEHCGRRRRGAVARDHGRTRRPVRGGGATSVAAAPLVSEEADHRCRRAKRSRHEGAIVTRAGVAKFTALTLALATRVKGWSLRPANNGQPPGCLRSPTMTEKPHKSGPGSVEFSGDVLESVEIVGTAAIEAPCRAA
jgi:hypothetical protein